jgi:hypothetical protein
MALQTDHDFDHADEFLNVLSPRDAMWEHDPLGWVYRGQADATWALRAKATRSPTVFREYAIAGLAEDWSSRADRQNELLRLFRDGLNQSGLTIPATAPKIVSTSEISHYGAEPLGEAFPLMALDQHHGLPTMLLDWSRRGWVAAYFGARLAVWALHRAGFPDDVEWRHMFYEAPGGARTPT